MKSFLRRNIFLVDGLGASLSALFLGLVLPRFEVGIPNTILIALSLAALAFGVYSLSCFFLKKRGGTWLSAIMVANLLYCVVTATIVGYFYSHLSLLATAYFFGEIMVILLLAHLEFRLSRQIGR